MGLNHKERKEHKELKAGRRMAVLWEWQVGRPVSAAARRRILRRGVAAVLCGHNHAGSYVLHDGIHYLAFKGMVERDTNAFAVVGVYPDRLDVIGFGREPSRTLTQEGEPETDAMPTSAR